MKDLSDCLAVLAVAAWANNDGAMASALAAIEAYAPAVADPDESASRLRDLGRAFENMKLDSALAVAIMSVIERRVAGAKGDMPTAAG